MDLKNTRHVMSHAARLVKALLVCFGSLLLLCMVPLASAQPGPVNGVMAFDATANADIKKIVPLKSSTPALIVERMGGVLVAGVGVNTGAALAFGAIGALVASGTDKTQPYSREVSAKIKALGFDLHDSYADQVKQALERTGYEVRVAAASRTSATKFVANLAGIADADEAVLDLGMVIPVINWVESEKKFTPGFTTAVRLARSAGEPIAYGNSFAYVPAHRKTGVTLVPLEEKYAFDSFETVLQNANLLVEAFQLGASGVAARIAADLKRRAD
jgi:hypothetical protein